MDPEGPKQFHFNYTALGTNAQLVKDMKKNHLAAQNCPQNVWDMLGLVFVGTPHFLPVRKKPFKNKS